MLVCFHQNCTLRAKQTSKLKKGLVLKLQEAGRLAYYSCYNYFRRLLAELGAHVRQNLREFSSPHPPLRIVSFESGVEILQVFVLKIVNLPLGSFVR